MSLQPDKNSFWWGTGIEDTFIPQVRPGYRALDEYVLTQHDQQWKSDFDRIADTGASFLRWGIPWYRVQPSKDVWDWSWTDQALEYLVLQKGIAPVLDLMHYGTPLWLDNSFINTSYPERVAEYSARAAERYASLVQYFTPLNEPAVNADMCGRQGEWPPYLCGDDGFVKVILALARGIVQSVGAMKSAHPGMVTIQVEALWHNWTQDTSDEVQQKVELGNERQYLCFDLCTGRVDDRHALYPFLRANGVREDELAWFQDHRVSFDILGANFYPWSYGEVVRRKDGKLGRLRKLTHGSAMGSVLLDTSRRSGLPIMVTETSANRNAAGRARWMDETIETVCSLRTEGIPIVGYTWFPVFTMIDWKYRTGRKPLDTYLINFGLYDSAYDPQGLLVRHPTPLVERYRNYIHSSMPPVRG